MWELDRKSGWAPRIWCLQTAVLEKSVESLLDCKEIQPVHPKGDQCWVFIGRTDAEADAPILWPPDAQNWLIGQDPDVGKDWRREEKGTTEDEMAGWHHWLNGHECEQSPGNSEGQGGLVAAAHGVTKSRVGMTEWLDDSIKYGDQIIIPVYPTRLLVLVGELWIAFQSL